MSYTTTIDTLTRDSRVYVDTQFNVKKQAVDKPKLSSFTGEDVDGYLNRWVTGRVLGINYDDNTVHVKLDPLPVEDNDTTEYNPNLDGELPSSSDDQQVSAKCHLYKNEIF
jgi:hypothetical protein